MNVRLRHLLFIGFIIRIIAAPFLGHSADIVDWWYYGHVLFHIGMSPLTYFVFYGTGLLYILCLFYPFYVVVAKRLFFNLIIKIPFFISDFAIAICIHKITKSNLLTAIWLFGFPTLFVSTIHGQIDVIPTALLFLSFYYLQQRRDKIAAVVLAAACSFKFFSLFLAPLFLLFIARRARSEGQPIATPLGWFSGIFAALFGMLSLPLLITDFAGVPLILGLLRSPNLYYGYMHEWRGGSINLLEFLHLDLGLEFPPFIVMFTVPFILILALAWFRLEPTAASLNRFIVIILAALYLTYPQLHLQHLLWAFPFIIISARGVRESMLYSIAFLPRFLAGNPLNYIIIDVRETLGITLLDWKSYWALLIGYFLVTGVLALLLAIRLFRFIPRLSRSTLTMPSLSTPNWKRNGILLALGVLTLTGMVAVCCFFPNTPYEADNRFLTSWGLRMQDIRFGQATITGSATYTIVTDDFFLRGYAAPATTFRLQIYGSEAGNFTVQLNGLLLAVVTNSDHYITEIPRNLIQEYNELRINATSWQLDQVIFNVYVNSSLLPPLYYWAPALIVVPVLSVTTLLASAVLVPSFLLETPENDTGGTDSTQQPLRQEKPPT